MNTTIKPIPPSDRLNENPQPMVCQDQNNDNFKDSYDFYPDAGF